MVAFQCLKVWKWICNRRGFCSFRAPRYIFDLWNEASKKMREREKKLKEKIEALLKEKWWTQEK